MSKKIVKVEPDRSVRTTGVSAESLSRGGRSKYKKAMCAVAKEAMAAGSSRKAVCAIIGVTSMTFYKYLERHPEFKKAVEEGEELSYKYWEDMGKSLAENGSASVWSLVMANRFGWRAKNELSGTDGGPLRIEIVQFKE